MAVEGPQTLCNLEEALSRSKQGDMDAFCEIVSLYESRLLGQALALSGDMASAEDLAQQTWIEAWKSLARFDSSCRLTTWLYSILLHVHAHWLRQRRSRPEALSSISVDHSERGFEILLSEPANTLRPDEALVKKELSDKWRRLTESLPEIHREAVLLRFFEDASLEEIAAVARVSVNTVKTRLHHALKKLRAKEKSMNLYDKRRHT